MATLCTITFSNLNWPPHELNKISNNFICPSCKKLFVNIHQTYDCGCRFCYECLDSM